jgi:CheY-like chemotaxis protein
MAENPKSINIAVIDKMMPDMDGIEMLGNIKSNNALKHIPVIIQTGDVGLDQMHEGLTKGAYYYLTKPFLPETLAAILKSAENECNLFDEMASKAVVEQKRIIRLITRSEFSIQTFAEARFLAAVLSHAGKPSHAARGLMELLFNAIEHGNLELGYQRKHDCLVNNTYNQEIAARLSNGRYANRSVKIVVENSISSMHVSIQNTGPGFNWRQYAVPEASAALNQPNGRGIVIARKLLGHIQYNEKGTEVSCLIEC